MVKRQLEHRRRRCVSLAVNPQVHSFMSVADVGRCEAAAGEPEKKGQDKQQRGGRAPGRRPGGAVCLFNGDLLWPVRIHKPIHLQSVRADDHRAEDQPDISAAGGSIFKSREQLICMSRKISKCTHERSNEVKMPGMTCHWDHIDFLSPACIQDLIYQIRARFNTDFEVLHKQKIQVINGMRERNRQIREMMMELGINETLWEPSLECMEQPEILLNVDDSEVTKLLWKHSDSWRLPERAQQTDA